MRIDLQDGFNGDTVEVYVSGVKVLNQEGVTTKRVLGFALSREIELRDGIVDIEIRVPTQNLSKTLTVDAAELPNLGISIRKGELKTITSPKRFGYA